MLNKVNAYMSDNKPCDKILKPKRNTNAIILTKFSEVQKI